VAAVSHICCGNSDVSFLHVPEFGRDCCACARLAKANESARATQSDLNIPGQAIPEETSVKTKRTMSMHSPTGYTSHLKVLASTFGPVSFRFRNTV